MSRKHDGCGAATRYSMIGTYPAYLGILPVVCYILFMLILYNLRNRTADVELQIRTPDVRR